MGNSLYSRCSVVEAATSNTAKQSKAASYLIMSAAAGELAKLLTWLQSIARSGYLHPSLTRAWRHMSSMVVVSSHSVVNDIVLHALHCLHSRALIGRVRSGPRSPEKGNNGSGWLFTSYAEASLAVCRIRCTRKMSP